MYTEYCQIFCDTRVNLYIMCYKWDFQLNNINLLSLIDLFWIQVNVNSLPAIIE